VVAAHAKPLRNQKTRIRNKLAFDLMSDIPHLLSMRTQFVNLWIDDGGGAVDYGLFTHVESPGANYLDKRGRSRDDRLYKADFLRFDKNDLTNVQVDEEGKPLDKDRFESSLEIEAGDDHRPLVKMLTAFNDPEQSFDSILDRYFDRNNVLTWMAVNFLLHQTDAVTHNFLLYNPEGTEKFYFLPWDYDGAFDVEFEPINSLDNLELRKRLYYGYARGFNSAFYSRYYRLPGIHQKLLDAAASLKENYLTETEIDEKSRRYVRVVEPFLLRSPDFDFNSGFSVDTVNEFPNHIQRSFEALQTRFSVPLPPTLLEPKLEESNWVFTWTPAHDPTGNSINYELQISSSKNFAAGDIVVNLGEIADSNSEIQQRVEANRIPSGRHYARVIARVSREPERFWQVCSNVINENGIK